MACGLDGSKTNVYRERVVQTCSWVGEELVWKETSRTKETQSEGACMGQSCTLADGSKLTDGQSRTFYSDASPAGSCESVSETRTCNNGQLSGHTTHTQMSCSAWTSTDAWGACSADCGGMQTRTFVCKNEKGAIVDGSLCKQDKPSESRLCDGNPNAVRREERSVKQEESGSTKLCPANQIGMTISRRDVTTVSTYACIDHKVALEGTRVETGAWVTESMCRDYVPHRCSKDSLSNTEAKGRYKWMVKCQDQLPVIKDFLADFSKVKGEGNSTIDGKGRVLYPTFMNAATKPEKTWTAPKTDSAACTMPQLAYVAAVCVSSCATPDQEILAKVEANMKLRYMPFIDALTQKAGFVGTLQSESSMSSKDVQMTRVDNWVTELEDTDHDIRVFTMKSGRKLKITPNHPVVTEQGTMKQAGEFRAGESLVMLGGQLDPIVRIDDTKYFGKVYNVFVKSASLHHNIVVTNGYLNGTAFYQNEGAVNLNRALFREKMTRGVFGHGK